MAKLKPALPYARRNVRKRNDSRLRRRIHFHKFDKFDRPGNFPHIRNNDRKFKTRHFHERFRVRTSDHKIPLRNVGGDGRQHKRRDSRLRQARHRNAHRHDGQQAFAIRNRSRFQRDGKLQQRRDRDGHIQRGRMVRRQNRHRHRRRTRLRQDSIQRQVRQNRQRPRHGL